MDPLTALVGTSWPARRSRGGSPPARWPPTAASAALSGSPLATPEPLRQRLDVHHSVAAKLHRQSLAVTRLHPHHRVSRRPQRARVHLNERAGCFALIT